MEYVLYIIDDSIVSEFATRIVLEQYGVNCKIYSFESGEVGLRAYMAAKKNDADVPDIILLDLKMPGMDGWEFLEELGSSALSTDRTAVYLISSYANSEVRRKAEEHHLVTGFLNRPLSKNNVDLIFSALKGSEVRP